MEGNFSLDLSRLVAKAKGQTELVVRKVMLEAGRGCVMKNPVREGRMRGNWQTGYGSYPTNELEVEDKTGEVTMARITAAIMSYRIDETDVFIVNNVPYAIPIEYGHSKQAPAGMVRTTLTEISSRYGA